MSVCYIMGFVLIASTSRCAAWNQEAHWPPEDTVSQVEGCPGETGRRMCGTRPGRGAGSASRCPLGHSPAWQLCPGRGWVGRVIGFPLVCADAEQGSPGDSPRKVARGSRVWEPELHQDCWATLGRSLNLAEPHCPQR